MALAVPPGSVRRLPSALFNARSVFLSIEFSEVCCHRIPEELRANQWNLGATAAVPVSWRERIAISRRGFGKRRCDAALQ